MSESATLRAIHAALGARPGVRLWRANVGVAVPMSLLCPECRRKPPIRFGLPGMADLLGVVAPSGRLLSIEVKSETGKERPEQARWREMVLRHGGIAGLARSVAEAEALIP